MVLRQRLGKFMKSPRRVEVGKLVQAKEWKWESLYRQKSGSGKACTGERVEVGKLVQAKEWRSESRKSGNRKACTGKRVEVGKLEQEKE